MSEAPTHKAVSWRIRWLVALTFVVALTAAAVVHNSARSSEWPPASFTVLITLIVAGVVARLFAVTLPSASGNSSVLYLPALCALLFAGPEASGLVAGLSVAIGDLLTGRKAIKLIFNWSQFAIAAFFAGSLFYASGGALAQDTPVHHLILPFVVAACTFFAVNRLLLTLMLVFAENRNFVATWRAVDDGAFALDITLALAAIPLVKLYWHVPIAGLILLLIAIIGLAVWPKTSMGRPSGTVS